MQEGGISSCGNAQNCVEACPRSIPLTESIAHLGKDVSKKMWKNIKRNENRARKKSGRARTNALNSMTPQGQALWCARNVENSANESLIKALDMSIPEVKK